MYRPKAFRVDDPGALAAFIAAHPFATLITVGESSIESTHLPMFLVESADGRRTLRGHIARANEQWRRTNTSLPALVVFRGDSHYISPNWYATKRNGGRVVPTYDYVVVEARGSVRFFDDPASLLELLNELTDMQQKSVGENWRVEDAPTEYLKGQLRAIVGVDVEISELVGAFKLSQNHPQENIDGVLAALERLGTPSSLSVAGLIRAHYGSAR